MFPKLCSPRYVELLREERPRALVILAWFFAVVAHTDALKYFGDVKSSIARREVNAIARILPPEWQGQVIQPLDETNEHLDSLTP